MFGIEGGGQLQSTNRNICYKTSNKIALCPRFCTCALPVMPVQHKMLEHGPNAGEKIATDALVKHALIATMSCVKETKTARATLHSNCKILLSMGG